MVCLRYIIIVEKKTGRCFPGKILGDLMQVYWIWMAEAMGPGGRYVRSVLEHFGSAQAVYELANRETLQEIEELGRKEANALCNKSLKRADAIVKSCEEKKISILTYEDENYPTRLRKIFSPPLVLYYRGTLPDFSVIPLFTIVGTRKSTKEGERIAYEFATQMSRRGIWVVSGLAEGIDTQANRGAVEGPSPTIAVLGCGVDVVYPAYNAGLMERVMQKGVVISEYPPGSRPLPYHFPIRNRIMAGLSIGVLVVEAPEVSGALITANLALEEGKEVFAVPGSIYAAEKVGSNRLLFDGAHPAVCPADIFECYDWELVEVQEPEKETPKFDQLSPAEQKIADLLQYHGKLFVDDLMARSGMPEPQVLTALTMMELKGIVLNLGGDVYQLLG